MLAVVLLLCLGKWSGQDPEAKPAPPPPITTESLLARFERLGRDQREAVVRSMEKRLAREDGDILQRIQSRQRGEAAYPPRPAAVWFEPRDSAPVATARQRPAAGTDAHRAATRRMNAIEFLPDLQAATRPLRNCLARSRPASTRSN